MRLRIAGLLVFATVATLLAPTTIFADGGKTNKASAEEQVQPTGDKPTILELHAPSEATVGQRIELEATLKDAQGNPVKGAKISFSSPAQFAGFSGEMDIDEAETNAQGIATIEFEARQEGDNKINAHFKGNSTYKASEASRTFLVEGGSQVFFEEAGVKIPYLGPWIIVLVLATVWGLYLTVMALVVRIANSPSASEGGWS